MTWSSEGTLECGRIGRSVRSSEATKGSRTPTENDKPQISLALSDFSARVTGKSCAAHHLVIFGSVLSELLLLLCFGLVSMMGEAHLRLGAATFSDLKSCADFSRLAGIPS